MENEKFGSTTIATDVLISIARLTALNVDGVKSTSRFINFYDRVVNKPENEGVKISIKDEQVYVDLYVILDRDVNIRIVSKNIQQNVSRAISEMVGMEIGAINVHICDINYEV